MGIVELKNDKIAIKVNTHGAELVSLKSIETDREYMWCGDAEYWGRVSPVLFPFVDGLIPEGWLLDVALRNTDITGLFMRIFLSTDLQGTASL